MLNKITRFASLRAYKSLDILTVNAEKWTLLLKNYQRVVASLLFLKLYCYSFISLVNYTFLFLLPPRQPAPPSPRPPPSSSTPLCPFPWLSSPHLFSSSSSPFPLSPSQCPSSPELLFTPFPLDLQLITSLLSFSSVSLTTRTSPSEPLSCSPRSPPLFTYASISSLVPLLPY